MKITINTDNNILIQEVDDKKIETDLYSKQGFEIISKLWTKVGWNEKYAYTFTWQGRPIIQLPEDMIRIQEVIYSIKPDVIIETGVAHGGSLIYYASLCKLLGKGKVIGVDIDIRPHNRVAIQKHELSPYITLIEGSSTEEKVLREVEQVINETDKVLVILDSNHSKEHVLSELESYKKFVSIDSYIVATDGIMEDLYDVPRGQIEWKDNNPVSAVKEFITNNPNFVVDKPKWPFNESDLTKNITHWPMAYLKKIE